MTMDWIWLGIAPALVFATTVGGIALLLPWLRRHDMFDRPGPRSAHVVPTPRGAGLAVVPVLAVGWGAFALCADASPAGIPLSLLGALLLGLLSWIDDLRGLPPLVRLAVQSLAVVIGLGALAPAGLIFQGWLPGWLDLLAAGLLWLWFLNLFNFMDGIDAIAGIETVAIGGGLAAAALIFGWHGAIAPLGLMLTAGGLGFLAWNLPPARIFLGDVGSVPLGYLAGWLLLEAAATGHWAEALILPAYFLADATITLGRRLAAGKNVLQSHDEHFYQVAARLRGGHAPVVRAVAVANLVLVALAIGAAQGEPAAGLLGAAAAVALLLRHLARAPKPMAVS